MITIVSTFTIDPITKPLQLLLELINKPAEIKLAPYTQIFQQLLDTNSLFMQNNQGTNIILIRFEDWLSSEYRNQPPNELSVATNLSEKFTRFLSILESQVNKLRVPLIIGLCQPSPMIHDNAGLKKIFEELEGMLQGVIAQLVGVYLMTSEDIETCYPVLTYHNSYTDKLAHIPYTESYFAALAAMLARKIHALEHAAYKVMVLDCDNTLWQGICGEASEVVSLKISQTQRALQHFIIQQQQMGTLICLCSKNSEADVWSVFDKHPDMLLKREHITLHRINWEEKVVNIAEMAQQLNLSLNSFIFIDDNIHECRKMQKMQPMVLTIQCKENILHILQHIWGLDKLNVTQEDRQRTTSYQQKLLQLPLSSDVFYSLNQFIDDLQLEVSLLPLTTAVSQIIPLKRAAELTRKTNQFNCTTRRFTDKQLQQLIQGTQNCLTVYIKDNEKNYGLKGVIIYKIKTDCLEVDNFLLSCEVLGRGAEHKILNKLGCIAKENKVSFIKFHFIPTDRNEPAENFLAGVCDSSIKIEEKEGAIFSISTENACCVQYEMPKNFARSEGDKKRSLTTIKNDLEKNHSIDYLRIANEFSTAEQILLHLKKPSDRSLFIKTTFKAPTSWLEKSLLKLWEECLEISNLGCEDNFTQLGGDSIKASLLLAKIYSNYGIEIPISDVLISTVSDLAALIEDKGSDEIPVMNTAIEEREGQLFPLSFAQQRLWFLDQLQPNSSLYNMFIAFELKGNLNKEALKQSFLMLIKRHESLRTAFIRQGGRAYQTILAYVPELLRFNWNIVAELSDQHLSELARQEAQQPFQLDSAPLLRVQILESTGRTILMICMHHIIHDGWSFHIFCKELIQVYSALVEKKIIALPEKIWDYIDFSHWQEQSLHEARQQQLLAYWVEQLAEFSPIKLPLDCVKLDDDQGYEGDRVPFLIKMETLTTIKKIARTNQATLFTTLFSIFTILIGRYAGQEDLVIGTPISGRHSPNLEAIIGFFVNILLLRVNISADPNFQDFLQQNKEMILKAYEHQDLPFEKLVSELNPVRGRGENPLANIMFIFQNYPLVPLQLPGLSCQRILSDNESLLLADYESTKVDLSLYVQETANGLQGLFEYNIKLFHRSTIERLISQFQRLLLNVATTPALTLSKLSLLDEEESYRLMTGLSTHKRDYPINLPLCTLLQQQVAKTPNSIALSLSEETLTYQQLNEAANQLAHHLVKLGLQQKQVVGICLDRSFDLMISLLALWKAGATSVCIDPNYPKERIRFIVSDCQPAMLISQGDFCNELKLKLSQPNEFSPVILDLNREQAFVTQQSNENLTAKAAPDEVLYIVYTSGSTGEPKGVLIEQRGVINMAYAQIDELGIHSQDHILQFARFTFDAFFWETLGAWLAGAQLCLISKEIKLIGNDLVRALKTASISIATLTPSVVETIPSGVILPDLRCLVLAGEAPSVATVEKWSKHCQVINAYGPSEATVCASLEKINLSMGKLSIGKPLANVEIYLLDANLQPVAIGIPGEIFIGGVGIARGYLNRLELTQSHFLTILLNGENKQLYKTGDKARWLSDGRLEFLGRIDKKQVKLRGFRIELDEVKQQLLKHPAIDNAVVKVYEQHLIAYLVTNSTIFSEKYSYLSHTSDQTQQWQILYEELYQRLDVTQPLNFNCLGWNSSYTKKSFLEEEMQEWVDTTVNRILSLKPKRVLEIGCGAGLLMARIAPYCDFYRATDFSAAAIFYLEKLKLKLGLHEKIQLLQRPAGIFNEKEHDYYDVIIINSVIQYFPDSEHLIQVIEDSIRCLQPGGKLFIGDIRSLVHLEMFHRMTMLHNTDFHNKISERMLVEKIEHEEELLVHADFFEKFAQRHSLLECAIVQLRRGNYINELTQFRYDVTLLKKGSVPIKKLQVNWLSWGEEFTTLETIQAFLFNESPVHLAIQNLPNYRLLKSEFEGKAIDVTHRAFSQVENPETLYGLAEKLGYQSIISWSRLDPLLFDIIFYRSKNELVLVSDKNSCLDNSLYQQNFSQYVNQPLKSKLRQGVLIDVKKKIKETLPDYMIPSNWYFIDEMPLTSHGKTDDKTLRQLASPEASYSLDLPTTDIEEKLCSIWKSCLQRDRLGINDNFFEIGGESLRAVELITKINEAFTIELPIKALIDTPTIKKLGQVVEKQQSQKEEVSDFLINSVIPLKKSSSGLPLFLIHPVGGTVFCYKNLVESLNFSGPCYAIQDPSIINKKIFLSSIGEMASYYVRLIKNFQTNGPYKIAGHSFGGTVATEIAYQLMQLGEEIQFVALFDTWARNRNKNKINSHVEKMLIKQYEEKKHSEYSAKFFQSAPPIDLSFWIKLGAERMHLALNHQFPKNLNFPLILFKAEESAGDIINTEDSPTNYWDAYCSSLKVHSISGNHESILGFPYVNKVAALLDSYLNADYKNEQDGMNIANRRSMNC